MARKSAFQECLSGSKFVLSYGVIYYKYNWYENNRYSGS